MPPRRNKCNSVVAMTMKKMIDNRLLEITLIVEDYIYENKPISRHEAEMYAKEVASYADKCSGDERSLQVIEKLRRHMKSIIAEQGEPIDEEIFAQHLPGKTPMYQVLDDDLTQCTQDIGIEDHTQEFNSSNCIKKPVENGRKKRKAIVKPNKRDNSEIDDDLTQCIQDTDIEIDIKNLNRLNSAKKTSSRAGNKRNVIVKRNIRITRGKRNVSDSDNSYSDVIDLCDDNCINVEERQQDLSLDMPNNEVTNTPADLSECSPSILNSFNVVPGISKSNKQKESQETNPGGNIVDKNNTVKNVDEYIKKIINKNNELKTDRNIPKEGMILFPNKDNTTKTNQINKQIHTQVNNLNKLKNISNTINVQKISVISIETPKNRVDGAINTYSKDNKLKKASIYNDKVINDLSWIDNIRYVREIAKEESENISVPNIFWDNYMLPENWNDDDFSYT